jgi:hypothetical protein
MSGWIIDRIDFIDNKTCEFCNRPLKTNIAYILIRDGIEVPAGPHCSHKNAKNPGERIPDFTKASLDIPDDDENGPGSGGGSGGGKGKHPRPAGYYEIEYLRLRAEKLIDFRDAIFPKLSDVYAKYKATGLDDGDIGYLDGLIKKVSAEKPLLSPKNLQICYAYSFWLQRYLDRKGKNDFISSILSQLKAKMRLSEAQLAAANKCFETIGRIPRLDTKAFL